MAENREKTYVADVDRSIYDIRDAEHDAYRMESGLTPEIVDKLSKEKGDPVWMQQFRLQSLQIYNELRLPDWGPSLEGLDIDHIATYVRPNTKMQNDWANVPQDVKDTFERLGIPQAERKSLAGVGAQYDSELVYHNVRDEIAAEGVVYTDMESALKGEYADMVRKYFMKLVTPRDHKFAALHAMLAPVMQALEKEKPSSAWTLETWHDRFNAWFELMQKERMMMSFVLSFISLISAFCIMAVMFTVSIQRKKEIAVMKALGATPFQVVRVFLWQGVIIGFVGALLGVGLGLLVLEYRMQIQGFLAGIGFDPFPVAFHGTANIPVVIDWAELAWQAVKAFVMVVVASIIPALITARQDPARSLRSM